MRYEIPLFTEKRGILPKPRHFLILPALDVLYMYSILGVYYGLDLPPPSKPSKKGIKSLSLFDPKMTPNLTIFDPQNTPKSGFQKPYKNPISFSPQNRTYTPLRTLTLGKINRPGLHISPKSQKTVIFSQNTPKIDDFDPFLTKNDPFLTIFDPQNTPKSGFQKPYQFRLSFSPQNRTYTPLRTLTLGKINRPGLHISPKSQKTVIFSQNTPKIPPKWPKMTLFWPPKYTIS